MTHMNEQNMNEQNMNEQIHENSIPNTISTNVKSRVFLRIKNVLVRGILSILTILLKILRIYFYILAFLFVGAIIFSRIQVDVLLCQYLPVFKEYI